MFDLSQLHLGEVIVNLVLGLLSMIGGWVLVRLNAWLTANASAADAAVATAAVERAKNLLHQALETGMRAALVASPDASPVDLARAAIAYAHQSIPDAIKALSPSVEVMVQIALSKLAPAAK